MVYALQTIAGVKDNFRTFKTLDVSFRRRQLENMRKMVTEKKKEILDAVHTDLHKVVPILSLCLFLPSPPSHPPLSVTLSSPLFFPGKGGREEEREQTEGMRWMRKTFIAV